MEYIENHLDIKSPDGWHSGPKLRLFNTTWPLPPGDLGPGGVLSWWGYNSAKIMLPYVSMNGGGVNTLQGQMDSCLDTVHRRDGVSVIKTERTDWNATMYPTDWYMGVPNQPLGGVWSKQYYSPQNPWGATNIMGRRGHSFQLEWDGHYCHLIVDGHVDVGRIMLY